MAQVPSPETNINNYRQICDYKISKFHTKIDERTRKLPDDPESMAVCETVLEREGGAQITVKFDGNSLYENETEVKFQGPSLSSTCTISGIKEKIYHREIGYIQTSKRFFENEFENAILYSDFHANLLHEQDEVLDCDGESSPFYSTKSCTKVPANEELVHAIELHFSDSPSSDILKNADNKSSETSPKHNWGYLLKHERYQQFFVYIVMRSKIDNKWKYEVVYSFDWFIYLKWIKVTGENNNIFEYNCGLNEHTTNRELPECVYTNEFYTCNDDQFEYRIDLGNDRDRFKIHSYPKSIFQRDYKSCDCIENTVLEGNVGIESEALPKMKFRKAVRNAVIIRNQERSWQFLYSLFTTFTFNIYSFGEYIIWIPFYIFPCTIASTKLIY